MDKSLDIGQFSNIQLTNEEKKIYEFLESNYGEEISEIYKSIIYNYRIENFPARKLIIPHCINELINYLDRKYKNNATDKNNEEVQKIHFLICNYKQFISSEQLEKAIQNIHKVKLNVSNYRHYNGSFCSDENLDFYMNKFHKFMMLLIHKNVMLDKIDCCDNLLNQRQLKDRDIDTLKKLDKSILFNFFNKYNNADNISFNKLVDSKLLLWEYQDSESGFRNIFWPAFPYLKRIANVKSKKLMSIFSTIFNDVHNKSSIPEQLIYTIVFNIGLELKNKEFIKIAELFLNWLKYNNNIIFYNYEELEKLISRLNELGKYDIAEDIIYELLILHIEIYEDIFFNIKREDFIEISKFGTNSTNIYEYDRIARIALKYFPDSLSLFEKLCNMYTNMILNLSEEQQQSYQLYTYISQRAAIEYHTQDEHNKNILYSFISVIRDISENILNINDKTKTYKLLQLLNNKKFVFFNRIMLYLLRVSNSFDKKVLEEYLTEYNFFENPNYKHEYSLLINEKFNKLSAKIQNKILSYINNGPNNEKYKENTSFVYHWKVRKLLPIKQYLNNTQKKQFKDYLTDKQFEESDKFGNYMSERSLECSSPIDADTIKNMSIKQLINYLNTFTANEFDFEAFSYIGLASTVQTDVIQNHKKYTNSLNKFKSLSKPIYINYIFNGLQKVELTLHELEKVINLGYWIFKQKRKTDIPVEEIEISWKDAQISFIELVCKLFYNVDNNKELSDKYLNKIFKILKVLVLQKDNKLDERNSKYSKDNDIDFYAINSDFGKILECLIFYTYWKTINNRNINEVIPLFDDILSKQTYLEMYAIFGIKFHLLYKTIPEWVNKHINDIFPENKEKEDILLTSFTPILQHFQTSLKLWDILRNKYTYIITNNLLDKESHLCGVMAKHLVNYFAYGLIDTSSEIIKVLLKLEKNTILRKEFILQIAFYKNDEDITKKEINRFIDFWEKYKLTIIQSDNINVKELNGFQYWYQNGKFNHEWCLNQLIDLSEKFNINFDEYGKWEILLEDLSLYTIQVFNIMKKLSLNSRDFKLSYGNIIIDVVKYIKQNNVSQELKKEKDNFLTEFLLQTENQNWIDKLKYYFE
ncbi:hypothetical protein HDR60_04825 [bacterium]|nr:hypothetical protein [bacterium]